MKSKLTPEQRRKIKLKTWGAGLAGGALGASTGYVAAQAYRKSKAGKSMRRLPGHSRAEFIAPVATAAGVAAYAANYQRKRMKRKYLEEQEVKGVTKHAHFDPTLWVIDSLMR